MNPSVNFRKRALVRLPNSDSDSDDEPSPNTSKKKFERSNISNVCVEQLEPTTPEKHAETIKNLVVKSVVAKRQEGSPIPTSTDNENPQTSKDSNANSSNCASNRVTYVHYHNPIYESTPRKQFRRKKMQQQIAEYLLAARRKAEGNLCDEEKEPKFLEAIRLKRFCDATVAMMKDRFIGENRCPLNSRETLVLKFNAVSSNVISEGSSKMDDSVPEPSWKAKESPSDTDDSCDDTDQDDCTDSRLSEAADIFDIIMKDKSGKIKAPKRKKRRSNQNMPSQSDKYVTLGPNNTKVQVTELLAMGYTCRTPVTEVIRILTSLVFDRETLATHSVQEPEKAEVNKINPIILINRRNQIKQIKEINENFLCPLKVEDIINFVFNHRQTDPDFVRKIIKYVCLLERNRVKVKQERKEAKASKQTKKQIRKRIQGKPIDLTCKTKKT